MVVLRHIVLFTLADDQAPEAEQLLADLEALPSRVPEIRGLMLGRLINEGGHQFALTVDLDDVDALTRYREHPDHVPAAQRLRALSSEVVVADITD